MSAYAEYETTFKDPKLLCDALKEMGFAEVIYNPIAQQLEGYHGDKREETAEIIVPRRAVGEASNDIGFKKQADGTYKAVISEFDSMRHDSQWMTKLNVSYLERGAISKGMSMGLRYVGKKRVLVNGHYERKLQFLAK